jgi:hypothetical protein
MVLGQNSAIIHLKRKRQLMIDTFFHFITFASLPFVNLSDVMSLDTVKETRPTTYTIKTSLSASDAFFILGNFKAKLSKDIQKEYNILVDMVSRVPLEQREVKEMILSSQSVSVADLVAYQIGWGKLVIGWYEASVKPEMPGDGFTNWDYSGLAQHFFEKYQYSSPQEQYAEFQHVVERIIEIVEFESETGNLDKEGVWLWCRLQSGKEWPLSKWIRVNTASPYNRASKLIRGFLKS